VEFSDDELGTRDLKTPQIVNLGTIMCLFFTIMLIVKLFSEDINWTNPTIRILDTWTTITERLQIKTILDILRLNIRRIYCEISNILKEFVFLVFWCGKEVYLYIVKFLQRCLTFVTSISRKASINFSEINSRG